MRARRPDQDQLRHRESRQALRIPHPLGRVDGLLALFLLAWWLLSGRPPAREFLALSTPEPGRQVRIGLVVGLAGWGLTVVAGLAVLGVLRFAGVEEIRPIPPLVRWLASQPFGSRVCLLYTSPSPRDRTRSRMPSSA